MHRPEPLSVIFYASSLSSILRILNIYLLDSPKCAFPQISHLSWRLVSICSRCLTRVTHTKREGIIHCSPRSIPFRTPVYPLSAHKPSGHPDSSSSLLFMPSPRPIPVNSTFKIHLEATCSQPSCSSHHVTLITIM